MVRVPRWVFPHVAGLAAVLGGSILFEGGAQVAGAVLLLFGVGLIFAARGVFWVDLGRPGDVEWPLWIAAAAGLAAALAVAPFELLPYPGAAPVPRAAAAFLFGAAVTAVTYVLLLGLAAMARDEAR